MSVIWPGRRIWCHLISSSTWWRHQPVTETRLFYLGQMRLIKGSWFNHSRFNPLSRIESVSELFYPPKYFQKKFYSKHLSLYDNGYRMDNVILITSFDMTSTLCEVKRRHWHNDVILFQRGIIIHNWNIVILVSNLSESFGLIECEKTSFFKLLSRRSHFAWRYS